MTFVSVALCTHNGAQFLEAQVRSICAQTSPPTEIVLSDDASSDGSVDVVQRTLRTCRQRQVSLNVALRVLENRQALGVVANFEQALRHCQGEFISLCDQDDIWQPDRLRKLMAEMESRPDLLLIHSDARLVDAGGIALGKTLFKSLGVEPWELERIHSGQALDVLLRASRVTGATTVFRRDLLDVALPVPALWWHDEWLGLVAASIGVVDVVEEALIDYRQHGGNVLGAPTPISFADSAHRAMVSERASRRLARTQVLWDRLSSLGSRVPADRLGKVNDLLVHRRFRASLPGRRLARVVPVARELLTGRYQRYSAGMRSVAGDLLGS